MPTTDNPTAYRGSEMDSKYDQFFRFAVSEPNDWTGHVESPLGAVSFLDLTNDSDFVLIVAEAMEAGYVIEVDGAPDKGYYLTRQDNNGIIWAMSYGDDMHTCLDDFRQAEKVYNEWELAEDEEQ